MQPGFSEVGHWGGQESPLFNLDPRAVLLPLPKLDPSLSPLLHSFPTSFSELQVNDINDDPWVGVRH